MRSKIITLLLGVLCLCSVAARSQQPLTLTFVIEHEATVDQDYIEMIVNVKSEDTSLKFSLQDAAEKVAFVRSEVEKYCLTNSKKKEECQQISESGKFNVEPQYRTIRGEPVFIAFAVSYQVTAKIIHKDGDIGPLIDRIGKRSGVQILSMDWKDANEQDEEMLAIDKGLEQAVVRCENVGGVLGEFLSVNEQPRFQLQQTEEQEEQEQEEQQPEIIKYKFVVKCLPKQKKEAASKKPKSSKENKQK